MIIDAVVRKVKLDETHSRVEVFSPKYPQGKPLLLLPIGMDGSTIKFITGWEDVMDKKKPFTLNGGRIDDDVIGGSTLIRGMQIQCSGDDTVYVVMDPALIS